MSDFRPKRPLANQWSDELEVSSSPPIGPHLDEDQLVDYSMEALTPEDLELADRHLQSCPDCLARIEHLLEVAEAWSGDAGAERLRAYSVRLLAERSGRSAFIERLTAQVRRVWESLASVAAAGQSFPLTFASNISAALTLSPSTVHFGQARTDDSATPSDEIRIAQPTAHPLSVLYTANGRELPDEAELFWGHEVWLVQVPCRIAIGPDRDVQSIGISVRFVGQDVEIIDVLPRPDLALDRAAPSAATGTAPDDDAQIGALAVDLHWNGTIGAIDGRLTLELTVRPLAAAGQLLLAEQPDIVGRLLTCVLPLELESSSVGVGEAWFLYAPGASPIATTGSIWLAVAVDKSVQDLQIQVKSWVAVRGVNGVPARLTGEVATLPVTLVRQLD